MLKLLPLRLLPLLLQALAYIHVALLASISFALTVKFNWECVDIFKVDVLADILLGFSDLLYVCNLSFCLIAHDFSQLFLVELH